MKVRLALAVLCLAVLGLWAPAAYSQDCRCYGRPVYWSPAPMPMERDLGLVRATVRGTREVAGFGAAVVTTLHPAVRIADWMGVVDRRQIVRFIRGR